MADLRRVSPGEPFDIPAENYNGFCDVSDWYKGQNNQDCATGGGLPEGTIPVRNNTGDYLPKFGIMWIEKPLTPPNDGRKEFQSIIAYSGKKPQAPIHYGLFCVAQRPIRKEQVGPCKVTGLTAIKLEQADYAFGRADIKDSEIGRLVTHPAGSAQVIWRADSPGDDGYYDAIVSLNFGGWWPRPLRGTTDASDANKVYLTGGFAIESVYSAWTGDAPGTSTAVLVDWLDGAPRYVIWQCPAEA